MAYNVRVMKQEKATTINRRKYDEEFKRSAVKMIDNGQSVRSVSHALGVSEYQLHKWKRDFHRRQPDAEKEVVDLRVRLRQVEMECDILKKCMAPPLESTAEFVITHSMARMQQMYPASSVEGLCPRASMVSAP